MKDTMWYLIIAPNLKVLREAEMIDGLKIVSYTIHVVQEKPSNQ